MTILLVPAFPFDIKRIDPHFQEEVDAWKGMGNEVVVYDHDSVGAGTISFRGLAQGPAIMRGWMLAPPAYTELYNAAHNRGIELMTTPDQYERAHTLPGWYGKMREHTARSWYAHTLNEATYPAIVKDHVKSLKHLWDTACFIPEAAASEQVIDTYRSERGDALVGGIVLREFIPDLTGLEVRTWWMNGKNVLSTPHPDHEDRDVPHTHRAYVHRIEDAVKSLDLAFCTVDLAERHDGSWIVMEVGDGGVSDRPRSVDAAHFVHAIIGEGR